MTLSARAHLAARIRGFYAILDSDDEALATALVEPAGCAAPVLQLRLKHAGTGALLAAAQMARRVTRAAGALLIINDRLDVALAADADGVHLGQDDLPLAAAIHALGAARARMLVGISTHDLAQVVAAVAGGADYLGFGTVYLLGCDFKMAEDRKYAFAENRAANAIRHNNVLYDSLARRFEALKPHFEKHRFRVVNCSPGSELQVFERMEFADAVAAASAECGKPVNTQGWYEPNPKPQEAAR